MRILHLVQCGPTTGGTVSHVATQVAHQLRRGLTVGVVAASEGVLTEQCRAAGADVFVDTTLSPHHTVPGEIGDRAAFLDLGRRWQPHIVHAHLMHAGFRGRELSAALEVPLVYTQHMFNPLDPFLRTARAARWAFPVIAVAKFAEGILRPFLGDATPVHYVPNGVDIPEPSAFRLNPSTGPDVLFCGRLSSEKGPDTAVLGFDLMRRALPDGTLHIIGTGPDEPLLRRMVSALDLGERVHFYGSVSGALTANLGADLLLASSRADAASLVLLEAMASGVPIVTTDVGGNAEIIRHDFDGVLVSPDDPRSLAQAALSVLASSHRGTSLARSALDRYRDLYRADSMVERTCAVYEAARRRG